jgi:hypothetical protein
MSLLDAPAFDERKAKRTKTLVIGSLITFAVLLVLTFAGYVMGHGWLFTNLAAEHDVNEFFDALEQKDYGKAYAIYTADPQWQQHAAKHKDYPETEFVEDWTTHSPVHGPIVSHHVDISRTDGTGILGTGMIVAVHVNGDHKVFMWYQKSDHTLTWPAVHELVY